MKGVEASSNETVAGPTLWDSIAALVAEEGLRLFDLSVPTARSGALRVSISRPLKGPEGQASTAAAQRHGDGETFDAPDPMSEGAGAEISRPGVSLEDCARVSRRISEFFESGAFERSTNLGFEWATDDWTIEVSSPGINRTLSRDDHFTGALGERVRLRLTRAGVEKLPGLSSTTVFGELTEADGETVRLREEDSGSEFSIPRDVIADARVDFSFGGKPKRKFSPKKGKSQKR